MKKKHLSLVSPLGTGGHQHEDTAPAGFSPPADEDEDAAGPATLHRQSVSTKGRGGSAQGGLHRGGRAVQRARGSRPGGNRQGQVGVSAAKRRSRGKWAGLGQACPKPEARDTLALSQDSTLLISEDTAGCRRLAPHSCVSPVAPWVPSRVRPRVGDGEEESSWLEEVTRIKYQ